LFLIFGIGLTFGTVVFAPLSGVLTEALGWESVFYIFGGVAVAFSIIWVFLIHEAPSEHPRISKVK
jgi:predicted MFS family arabinose efflux permease